MSWVAVAIGGSALLGYMGSQNAASAQTSAASNANSTQQAMYNQTRQDQTPWRNAGGSALGQLSYMMGLPGYGPSNGGSLGSSMGGPRTVMGGLNTGIEGWGARPQGGPATDGSGMGAEGTTARGGPLQLTNDQQSAWASSGYDPSMYQSFLDAQGQGGGYGAQGGSLGSAMGQDASQYNPAIGSYGSLMTPFSQTNWQTDPGYAFRLSEGSKALERSAASKGMSLSGAQQQALSRYNQGFASNEYGNVYGRYNNDQTNQFNRLSSMAGLGQQANNSMANVGMNTANQIGSNQLGAGNANAAAWTAGTGALSNGLNSWNNYNAWNSLNNGYGSQMNSNDGGWSFGPPRG